MVYLLGHNTTPWFNVGPGQIATQVYCKQLYSEIIIHARFFVSSATTNTQSAEGLYLPLSTIMGKKVGTLCLIQEKKWLPFSNSFQCNVDPSHVVRSLARSPNIDLWGRGLGRIMVKTNTSAFYWTMPYPISDLSKQRDICNKLRQVFQLFFPWL